MSNTISPMDSSIVSNSNGTATSASSSTTDPLGENEFLNLLVTQLQNQDPSQPVDDSQWLSELAQFSSLEQMSNINTTLTSESGVNQIGEVSSLIGKTVTTSATDASGNPIGGVVSSVGISNGAVNVTIGSNQVTLDQLTGIASTPTTSASNQKR